MVPFHRRRHAGFTLVELLVVVAIIALLVAILLPSLAKAKEITRRTICATNLSALAKAYYVYFGNNNYRTPQMSNAGFYGPNYGLVLDTDSCFNFLIWCRSDSGGWPSGRWLNTGVLFGSTLIGSEYTVVCPTIRSYYGGGWFSSNHGSFGGDKNNPWPPIPNQHGRMTYGTRRFNEYDDKALCDATNRATEPRLNQVMLLLSGVESIRNASSFSYMADNFSSPGIAMSSHVPGVNVMYMDTHVAFWQDPTWNGKTGKVLYDNDLSAAWNNRLHDDIWMIIDKYHQPPLGSGLP